MSNTLSRTRSPSLFRHLDAIQFLPVSAWLLLLGLTGLAAVRPVIGYDSWWYHLPFSSFIWNIGGGAGGFHLDDTSYQRWQGFPLLWEAIQGLFWLGTGSIRAIILPQLLLCFVYFAYVRRALDVPTPWVVLGFFACPMLLIHFQSTYLDLASGASIALMFFVLTLLVADARNGKPLCSWQQAVGVVAMAAIAGNTKYQGLLACLSLSTIMMVGCLAVPRLGTRQRCLLAALLVLANLAAGASALANLARHGNPFYPIQVQVLGKVVFDGPESPNLTAEHPSYLLSGSREVSLPGPVNFVLSATEFDWVLRGVAPWYNIDSVSGRSPRRGPPSRTGGWGSVFVLLNIGLLLTQVVSFARIADQRQRLLVVNAVLLTLVTACLPRAHELRYWLYLPLVLMPVNLRFLYGRWGGGNKPIQAMLLAVAFYGVALAFLSPKSELLSAAAVTEADRQHQAPPTIMETLARTGRFCDPSDDLLFRYSTAVTGIPGILSRNAEDCR